ncbi:sugar lactone lactonase YvrE [Evansella vedderi]|uniref:Sugar lactone lactonase YvrE n=1 Tax=Evansella vedderi TaxID=38282 RepID=A0ABU0A0U6_9BACI|nr:SMP-30/gluconolactonase/LRE family protein [Evansella vedderi]MDQ0257106.1 sugar lactone lactonase YvrE [Evansella vedderi]
MRVVGNERTFFGEGPFWDHDNQCLYRVDITNKRIISVNLITEEEKTFEFPEPVTSMVKYSKDELIITMKDGLYLFHTKDETLEAFVKPEGLNEKLLLNDAKCDPEGRLWVGSVNDDFKLYKEHIISEFIGGNATLYKVDTNLDVQPMKDKVTVSNGMDWDRERNFYYYVDSATEGISRFDYDPKTGKLSNEEVVYKFNELDGFPDGMTIDQEGMLWVALFKSGQVAKKNPSNGIIAKINPFEKKWVDSITVPTTHVTSCAFGGEDLSTLFISTAIDLLPEEERKKQPLAGRLFAVDLDVGGYAPNVFRSNVTFNRR